ncbi:MAG: hypothetical protein JSS99_11465 [Actinobacteria bacterium]|nr:hypothetical protein [Actinomycetota bacterium]
MDVELAPVRSLRPGHVIELPDGPAEVLGKPFLGQRGASAFDASTLFWRVRIRPAGEGSRPSYATWDIDEQVAVRRRGDPVT